MYQPHEFTLTEDGYQGPAPSWASGAPSLWLVDTESAAEAARVLAPGILDASELARMERLAFPADRACYTSAHLALRLLLGALQGVAPEAVRLTRERCPSCDGPHGRPATGGGTHFSLSHTRGVALLAFAGVPVGVDVERVPGARVVREIAAQLHPAEADELDALPQEERPAAFARVWTRKEAYLKGEGTGLAGGLHREHVGTGPHPLGPPGWAVTDVSVPAGYAAAVAVRAAGRPPAEDHDRRK
ncbi:4'-phosphopantetheinyl transferase family protein [Streptomyces drozdowiczii]|uniref:4'-phosphopantetheinyl transferase superfamily protein n=1 Tax=Streptomyces drozdowiczii TaxID=202862 RepID=A0ABY6Q0I6_9ACTN|nr:4'-phosphopantetheinyl transferase superfamily protein [Streptomyces drozdowiczii]MCX0242343.1 4'-phosphopantetheinyl transferase superfamily protein [Streptomyces drozdowiczii]UZK57591.1 4'-phosphopantetheinyl transferase superfamily protein [Streptomyces drozdowiczii]